MDDPTTHETGAPPAPAADGFGPHEPPAAYPTNNATAVVALVSTLLPFPVLGAVLGVVLGVCARREIQRHGQTGEPMAVVAIVLGAVELGSIVIFVLLMLITAGSIVGSAPRSSGTSGQPVASASAAPPTAAAAPTATAAPATPVGQAQPAAPSTVSSPDAVGTVGRYFAAVNAHDYQSAYATFGSAWRANHPYGAFASGFSDTAGDQMGPTTAAASPSADGSRDVHVDFVSRHTDGSTVPYTCNYTVGSEQSRAVITNGSCTQA